MNSRENLKTRRWPAEWEPHRATWLSWPHNNETWPGKIGAVEDAFCEIVRAVLPGEYVEINVRDVAHAEHVRVALRGAGIDDKTGLDRIRFRGIPTDDAWIRDHGGIFVVDHEEGGVGRRVLLDFEFDAWGGKYPPWDHDVKVAEQMSRITRVRREAYPLVMEGGALDGDGEGTLLTTESCLLHPNRNRPGQDRSKVGLEAQLREAFGAECVIWLGDGIAGDDTDGHVDDLTRFVGPGRVVTVVETNVDDENHGPLAKNLRRLESARDARGRRLEITQLPMPLAIEGTWGRVPASYANFYFSNAALLVPVFGVDTDREALSLLESVVMDRPVVPIPSQNLVLGLGAVHCVTQQEPTVCSS